MGKIVLVSGGARSGKSRFAEQYAARYGKKVAYIATAEIYDEEMAFRVQLHQKRRPENWQTYEAPFDAHIMLKEAGKDTAMMVLFTNMDNVESISIATEGTVAGKAEVGKVTLKA